MRGELYVWANDGQPERLVKHAKVRIQKTNGHVKLESVSDLLKDINSDDVRAILWFADPGESAAADGTSLGSAGGAS